MPELSNQEIEEIEDHFRFFDTDNNGLIDLKEFGKLLKVISPESNGEEAETGFSIIDSNEDGNIDMPEFIAWWKTNWQQF